MRPCASFPPSSGYTAMWILRVEWLCTQERWNQKVTLISAAARYLQAALGVLNRGMPLHIPPKPVKPL
jgi:hypothetical protein